MAGLAIKTKAQTVFVSAKGEKYHTADCKLSGDADGITLADAKKAGMALVEFVNQMNT